MSQCRAVTEPLDNSGHTDVRECVHCYRERRRTSAHATGQHSGRAAAPHLGAGPLVRCAQLSRHHPLLRLLQVQQACTPPRTAHAHMGALGAVTTDVSVASAKVPSCSSCSKALSQHGQHACMSRFSPRLCMAQKRVVRQLEAQAAMRTAALRCSDLEGQERGVAHPCHASVSSQPCLSAHVSSGAVRAPPHQWPSGVLS